MKKQLESLPVLKPIEAESQDEKFLSNIIRLIEDHLSESELNVNALCELSGISNKQIYRKIKQLTGMSPVSYTHLTLPTSDLVYRCRSDVHGRLFQSFLFLQMFSGRIRKNATSVP